MPFNGTGSFTLVAGNPFVTGTVISSTVVNNTMSDFATGFTNCITRDGQSAALSNIPMGGFKHTGAANASATGEYLAYGQTNANLSSLTVGTLTTTGNSNVNGNVTIGDAASDTLTINPNAVAWAAGSVIHSGNHTFSGNLSADGNSTLGNAAGDAVTINASTLAFPNGTTVSGNVTFSGTSTLNPPSGSFTPGITFGGGSTGVSYNINRRGRYVQVGDILFGWINMSLSSKGSSTGAVQITGLPFAPSSSSQVQQIPVSISSDSGAFSGLTGSPFGQAASGSTSISLYQWSSTGAANITDANFTNTTALYLFFVYRV